MTKTVTKGRYFEGEQGYYDDPATGAKLRSITSALKVVPKPFLIDAAGKVNRDRTAECAVEAFENIMRRLENTDDEFPLTKETYRAELEPMLLRSGYRGALVGRQFHKEEWDAKRDTGSGAHEVVEWDLSGREGPNPLDTEKFAHLTDKEKEGAQWAAEWALDWIIEHAEIVAFEHVVYDRAREMAGRCDLFLKLTKPVTAPAIHSAKVKVTVPAGARLPLDLKSGKAIYGETELQVQFYAEAFGGDPPMLNAGALRLPKEFDGGEPELRLVDPERWAINRKALDNLSGLANWCYPEKEAK